MRTTLFTTLIILLLGYVSTLSAQDDTCPKQNRMKEGSCIIIEYPSSSAAIKAISAPAETILVTESTDEVSNGVYIAQLNCGGNEVVYTKAGACNCDNYTGIVAGTFKFTHADMTCKFDAAGVLPVEFKFFNGKKDGDMTYLEWATAFETDNEGFYVEKSTDGKFFQEFTFIVGEGNSSAEVTYDALDRDPFSGANYYRLKQVDYNGNERYSDIVTVDFRASGGTYVNYNSARDELTVKSENELQSIEIYDMAGIRIYKGTFDRNNNEHTINIGAQQSGHFVALITDKNGNIESTKFAKL